jgi:hypothetical protein
MVLRVSAPHHALVALGLGRQLRLLFRRHVGCVATAVAAHLARARDARIALLVALLLRANRTLRVPSSVPRVFPRARNALRTRTSHDRLHLRQLRAHLAFASTVAPTVLNRVAGARQTLRALFLRDSMRIAEGGRDRQRGARGVSHSATGLRRGRGTRATDVPRRPRAASSQHVPWCGVAHGGAFDSLPGCTSDSRQFRASPSSRQVHTLEHSAVDVDS